MKRSAYLGCLAFPLALLGILFVGYFAVREAARPKQIGGQATPVHYKVAPGASVAEVSKELETRELIRSAAYFRWVARKSALKPGVYTIDASQTPEAILDRIASGKVDTTKVTFPEGFTIRQMAARLKKNEVITDEEAFLKMVTEQGKTLGGSAFPKNLEGFLFPDTYQFPAGETSEDAARRMTENFRDRVLEGPWQERRATNVSLFEAVTVASMIEREAEVDEDRPLIAGVIYNRLKKGMKLQIDATVQYARREHKERLLYSDLKVDSPYNTYQHTGLPPGPICCPGLPSLEAAMNPAETPALFYVDNGEGTGKHAFANTYAEHLKNVAVYRKKRAERAKLEKATGGVAR